MSAEHPERSASGYSRRRALGLLAAGAASGMGGCLQRSQELLSRGTSQQVSLSIKVLPADADPRALRIARTLEEHLTAVGVDAKTVPMNREALYRDVLLTQQFDLYVARFPERVDPDFLRPLLHSRYVMDPGWQNPFGFADLDIDELLVRQRDETGQRRRETLANLQRELARVQPFSVVAFADQIRATRASGRFDWAGTAVHTTPGYLSLSVDTDDAVSANRTTSGSTVSDGVDPGLTMTLTDGRPLENLNPLMIVYRDEGTVSDLLYDPLGRYLRGAVRPWLAADWRWDADADESVLEVTLRDGLEWHDGVPLDASDVAFTYRFLRDTSLGGLETAVPAPRFHGRVSHVSDVIALNEREIRISFETSNRQVARRALTVPLLPTHVWEPKTRAVSVPGVNTDDTVTEALLWSNRNPVGCGAFRVRDLKARESLELAPFEDHFLTRADDAHLRQYRGERPFDRLVFTRAPSPETAVSMVAGGDADGTATEVLPQQVPTIGRDPRVDLHVKRARNFYHVGYNTRNDPLGNPLFRRAIAGLLDKAALVETVFDGYARPTASPLARYTEVPPELQWDGDDPVTPFVGSAGDLDVDTARTVFREAGYRYNENGELLVS